MSLLDALSAGRSGLRVASAGLSVVAQNVTNATTEGYSRRTLNSTVADPVRRYGLMLGQGARATGTGRMADQLLDARLTSSLGDQARSKAALDRLSAIESTFEEGAGTDVVSAYEDFFDQLDALRADPSDDAARLETVDAASRLAAAVNRTDDTLRTEMSGIVDEVTARVEDVQASLDAIAGFNARIAASGGADASADYADQAFQLVQDVAETIGATASFGADGQVTLFVGGHAVVSGATARTLSVSTDADGTPKVTVSADSGTIDVSDDLGGAAGGLLDAWDVASSVLSKLDDFASTFADAFNAQHAAGYDANGDAGGDFFSYDAGSPAASFAVASDLAEDPSLIAAAGASTAEAGDSDNLQSLVALQDEALFDGGTKTGSRYLSSLASTVGSSVSTASLDAETNEALVDDLSSLRDAVSGVDLDEEAASLLEWQAAYEAASRVISTADSLLGELMDVVR